MQSTKKNQQIMRIVSLSFCNRCELYIVLCFVFFRKSSFAVLQITFGAYIFLSLQFCCAAHYFWRIASSHHTIFEKHPPPIYLFVGWMAIFHHATSPTLRITKLPPQSPHHHQHPSPHQTPHRPTPSSPSSSFYLQYYWKEEGSSQQPSPCPFVLPWP